MAAMTRKPWTAEELQRLPEGWRYEIDEGELVIMTPAGWRHNRAVTRIARLLGNFVEERGLGGEVITNELGILLRQHPVHTLRAPDVGRKVGQYLEAGVRAVWVVDLEARALTRHAPGEEPRTWSGPDALVEEPLLPGFSCRLAELIGEG